LLGDIRFGLLAVDLKAHLGKQNVTVQKLSQESSAPHADASAEPGDCPAMTQRHAYYARVTLLHGWQHGAWRWLEVKAQNPAIAQR